MHVTWIVPGVVEKRPDGRLFSTMASVRYRVLYVAEYLASLGHRIDIVQAGISAEDPQLESPLQADVVVISKGLFEGSVQIAERAKSLGAKVVMDICDDHFDTVFRDTYRLLCKIADGITASTTMMAEVISRRAGRTAQVIGDPFEAPLGEARFQPEPGRVRLLWFGHPSNFDTLSAMMPSVVKLSREMAVDLRVVSEEAANIRKALDRANCDFGPSLKIQFTPWSAEATWQALADCDAVLIPSLSAEVKQVKSPNRLVESIRCGRFVAAYPLPSYEPLANYAWLGEDVVDGVRWALSHPKAAEMQVRQGQQFIAATFNPAYLAKQWEAEVLHYAASRPASWAKPVFASQLVGSMARARS